MAESQSSSQTLGRSTPLALPLYSSSVYTLPDLDVLDRIMNGAEPGFIYARDGHPNARHLADALTALENSAWTVICGSGMAALSVLLLSSVSQGDRVIASNRLYGRTSQLLQEELSRLGVATTWVDSCNLSEIRAALSKPARVLLVETLSNPLLRLVDIYALAEITHKHDCKLVVDNTFATPILLRPLELGADFVMESLTKMINGHSDVTLGSISGCKDVLAELSRTVSIWGLAASPFDCWLASRGLATLSLRMRAASANAAVLADWLTKQSGVIQVIYPGRSDHPDHRLACEVFQNGFGNMLCFELAGGRAAVNRFLRLAQGIPFSPSLGDATTTCSHPASTSHRYVSAAEKRQQGITDGHIRLSVGVEDIAQIQQELLKGLS